MNSSPTLFIVDDDRGFLKAAHDWLKSARLSVVACDSARAFLSEYQPGQPGCLLLDVVMPEMSGLELLEELNRRQWTIPTIAMTARSSVHDAVRAMKLGALDYVEKPFASKNALIQVARRALQAATSAQQIRAEIDEIGGKLAKLSEREHEVLRQVADGLSSKEIAHAMNVSTRTVESQRLTMMKKLEAESIPQLVRMVLRYSVATESKATLAAAAAFDAPEGRSKYLAEEPTNTRKGKPASSKPASPDRNSRARGNSP
jgi:FixJ family two-component response regulator